MSLTTYSSRTMRDARQTVVGEFSAATHHDDGRIEVVAVGVGWDDEHPVSLWPHRSSTPNASGHPGWAWSWLGLYLNVRTIPAPKTWRCGCGFRVR